MKYRIFILLFSIIIAQNIYSQDITKDTTLVPADSTVKSLIDTTKQVSSDINEIINYTAYDSVVFNLETNKMMLYNEAEVIYKDLKLNSGIIIMDRETQLLEAEGLTTDSSGTTIIIQLPLMYQGKDRYEGSKLTYSFKSQQGTISKGYSDAEVGYYFGERIKKVTPEVFFIGEGRYTTSTDKIDPEYYFYSPKMKVIPKDKVIGESVFLYIEGVPVFWIPFIVLPDRSGRSSGLLVPTYGTDAKYGLYLANFGYYWAINDYTDFAAKTSLFTKGRYDFSGTFRYAKKYNFSGTIEAGYSLIKTGEEKDVDKFSSNQWLLSAVHNQKLNPTTTIDGNVTFVSGKSYYDNSTNALPLLLRQNVVSNLTFSKFWEETPFSLTLNYYRDQNLQSGDVTERLPNIGFVVSETYPFRKNSQLSPNPGLQEYFSFSYSVNARNDRTKISVVNPDGTYGPQNTATNNGAIHNLNLNFAPASQNFNIRPYFNYTELWYSKYIIKSINPSDSSLTVEENKGIKAVRYFQTGVSLNTKLIGIFTPQIFGVTGIRHTITPSISYNYRPDFSSDFWGYYGNYADAAGRQVKYSFYEQGIFGTAPAGEFQSINFNVGNLLEMKTRENDTTENKFQLLNFNIGTNYNFALDSLKWSEITADFRTQIGSILNIGGNMRFNLYEFDQTKNTRVNTFLCSSQKKIADLTGFNINMSSGFNFTLASSDAEKVKSDTTNKEAPVRSIMKDEASYNIPLSANFNFNYSEARDNPSNIFKSSNISTNLTFSPTPKWKFSFSASYDILNKIVSAPYVTAYRDLNSWEINFNWYPIGQYRGFFFEIRIKAPQLREIKVTKETNRRGAYTL